MTFTMELLTAAADSHGWVNGMKDTGLNGYVYDFSFDYFSVDIDNILNIHKYLMSKNDVK